EKTEFASFAITGDTMVVAVRENHPLVGKPVEIQDLEPYGWLLPRKSGNLTTLLKRPFELHELPKPRVQIETDTVIMLRRIIAQTDLVTFLSRRDLAAGD